MQKHSPFLLVVIALVLAACSGGSPASPTISAPTATKPAAVTPKAEATATMDSGAGAAAEAPAGCTVISPQNTPGPTEQSIFPPVTDKDWSTGPKDAAITLIEYGDFM
jgi:hypothetical protein